MLLHDAPDQEQTQAEASPGAYRRRGESLEALEDSLPLARGNPDPLIREHDLDPAARRNLDVDVDSHPIRGVANRILEEVTEGEPELFGVAGGDYVWGSVDADALLVQASAAVPTPVAEPTCRTS